MDGGLLYGTISIGVAGTTALDVLAPSFTYLKRFFGGGGANEAQARTTLGSFSSTALRGIPEPCPVVGLSS